MKSLLTLTTITCLIACNQGKKIDNNKMVEALTKIDVTDNNNILGQWTMCSTFSDGKMINYNVCPIVNFGSYGTGSVIYGSGASEIFRWTLKNNTLRVSYVHKDSSHTFLDSAYTTLIGKQKNSIELEIRDIRDDGVYYLSKHLGN